MGDRFGRKRILIAGWLVGLPVPVLIMAAPSWEWVVFANILLGINQGLCWSMTVIMKIDLAGPARRGLAMGLNESAGYLAVSAAALASGYVAAAYGFRPYPFYLGVAFASAGLLASVLFVRESHDHAKYEASLAPARAQQGSFRDVFLRTSWKDRSLFAVSQAGLINNLNDGMAWGLLPLYFAAAGLSLERVAMLAAVYPAVWGLGQLATGAASDRVGRKHMIEVGMWVQAAGIFLLVAARRFDLWMLAATLLGLGTAMVYPTLLAAIGDVAHPGWRASAVGVYRLWRDSGYVAGALLAGAAADWLGMEWAIGLVAGVTLASGLVVRVAMHETLPPRANARPAA
jgi:MFS family permease